MRVVPPTCECHRYQVQSGVPIGDSILVYKLTSELVLTGPANLHPRAYEVESAGLKILQPTS